MAATICAGAASSKAWSISSTFSSVIGWSGCISSSGSVVVDELSTSASVVCGVLVCGVGCVVCGVVSTGRVEED